MPRAEGAGTAVAGSRCGLVTLSTARPVAEGAVLSVFGFQVCRGQAMSGSADVVVSPARVVVPGLRLPPWQPLRHADHPHGCAGLAGWECETVATTVLPSYAATLTVLAAVVLSGCAGQAEHRPAAPGITEPPRARRRTWETGRERHADGGRTDRRHDPYEAARRSYPPRLPAARITRDASRSRSCAVPQHSPGQGLRSSWRASPCPRTRLCHASPALLTPEHRRVFRQAVTPSSTLFAPGPFRAGLREASEFAESYPRTARNPRATWWSSAVSRASSSRAARRVRLASSTHPVRAAPELVDGHALADDQHLEGDAGQEPKSPQWERIKPLMSADPVCGSGLRVRSWCGIRARLFGPPGQFATGTSAALRPGQPRAALDPTEPVHMIDHL